MKLIQVYNCMVKTSLIFTPKIERVLTMTKNYTTLYLKVLNNHAMLSPTHCVILIMLLLSFHIFHRPTSIFSNE